MQTISNLIAYLKRHPGYIARLIGDIFKLFWYKCTGRKILVITTGSGGIGDYLWIRSFFPLINTKEFKVILIAMSNWDIIIKHFDKKNVNIIRYFESCLSPKKIETFFFSLFYTDIYLNFCKECIGDFVKFKKQFTNDERIDYNWFYEKRNNTIFSNFSNLPYGFRHSIPIIPPSIEKQKILKKPYVVLTEGGNTHGKFNDNQLTVIINHLIKLNYKIFFNGNYARLKLVINENKLINIIDGYTFPLYQYGFIIEQCNFVVTVNTSIYHFALLLNKPCIIITPYEPRTIKLDNTNQINVFNDDVIKNTNENIIAKSNEEKQELLSGTDPSKITTAIDKLLKSFKKNSNEQQNFF